MCSILGAFGPNSKSLISKMNLLLKHRGSDSSKVINFNNLFLGHNLLSIVGFVPQPFVSKNYALVANCEIYNWEKLTKEENLNAKNDAELLFLLLQKHKKNPIKAINKLNGDFAFAFFYKEKNKLKGFLARDVFGIKPLWYYFDKNNFYFASERKALPKAIKNIAIDLNPRILLKVELGKEVKVKEKYLGFFEYFQKEEDYESAKKRTENLIRKSIKNRIKSDKKVAVLVSGGVDSSLIAKLAEKCKKDILFYNISTTKKGIDKEFAEKLQKYLNNKIKFITVDEEEVIKIIPKAIKIIETADPIKVSIALPFYFLAKQMQKDKIRVVLVGNGADSLFCGFSRFLSQYSPTKDSISKLRKLYDTDCYRDDTIFMHFGIEARFPYLDKELVKYVLSLPDKYKIDNNNRKIILRDIARKYLPDEFALRGKKAIQYGSGFDKLLTKCQKIMKKENRGQFTGETIDENEKFACLFSGGKDSVLALHIMRNMNYKISCLVTIDSTNKDSYMYHTPTMNLVNLQAKALGIPLVIVKTKGKKEEELSSLKKALQIAKKKYNINGVITGALYSTYQRDRVEKISDELGLKVFSPLWHKVQSEEVKELINLEIKAIITKVAAYGLNKEFLGKTLSKELLQRLNSLPVKINIAGEGGEYETSVLDCPLFKKKIEIEESEIKIENEFTGELIVKKARLVAK